MAGPVANVMERQPSLDYWPEVMEAIIMASADCNVDGPVLNLTASTDEKDGIGLLNTYRIGLLNTCRAVAPQRVSIGNVGKPRLSGSVALALAFSVACGSSSPAESDASRDAHVECEQSSAYNRTCWCPDGAGTAEVVACDPADWSSCFAYPSTCVDPGYVFCNEPNYEAHDGLRVSCLDFCAEVASEGIEVPSCATIMSTM